MNKIVIATGTGGLLNFTHGKRYVAVSIERGILDSPYITVIDDFNKKCTIYAYRFKNTSSKCMEKYYKESALSKL